MKLEGLLFLKSTRVRKKLGSRKFVLDLKIFEKITKVTRFLRCYMKDTNDVHVGHP